MGVSTDAILFYGIDFDESIMENQTDEADDVFSENPEGWLAKYLGCDAEDWKTRSLFLEATAVELVKHCSVDFPMYALAIRGSVTRAYRGYPKQVAVESRDTGPWDELLAVACDKLGLLPKARPAWLLVSMWS